MPLRNMILDGYFDNAIEMLKLMTREARGEKKEKITVLLGAGLSQTAGIPSGLNLRDRLYEHWRLLIKETNRYIFKRYRNKFSLNSEKEIKRIGINSYDLSFRPDGKTNRDPHITFEMVCSVITGGLEVEKDQVEYFLRKEIEEGKKIPFGYEILAHLVGIQLVDDIVSLNYDTLFEKALDEEIGRSRYSLIVSNEEFKNALSNGSGSPSVIKPHGSLGKKGSILFTTNDVLEFDPDRDNLLANKLANSSIIIIGCSCSSPDIQKLLKRVASRDYTHCIYWIMSEEDKDSFRTIGDFGDNLKLILAKKDSNYNLNDMLHAFSNKINSHDVADFDLVKLGRHEIRNFFWGGGGIQEQFKDSSLTETVINKFLLEIIIFAVKIEKDFTEEELLACPRIVNFIDQLVMFKGTVEENDFGDIDPTHLSDNETIRTCPHDVKRVFFNSSIKNEDDLMAKLEDYEEKGKKVIVNLWKQTQIISPKNLLKKLVDNNFLAKDPSCVKTTYSLKKDVFKQLGDMEYDLLTKKEKDDRGHAILSYFAEVFDFNLETVTPQIASSYKNEMYKLFHKLVESFDVDLDNDRFKNEIHLHYQGGEILKTKAHANQLMKNWLKKAKTVKGVTKDGRWIINNFAACINDKADTTLLLVKNTLEHRLKKLNCNVDIKVLKQKNKYDVHEKRFTIIETFDKKTFVLYTLRKGNIGCMFWSKHDDDIKEANEYFNNLLKEVEPEKVEAKVETKAEEEVVVKNEEEVGEWVEKRRDGNRLPCRLITTLKPGKVYSDGTFQLSGAAENISPHGLAIKIEHSGDFLREITRDEFVNLELSEEKSGKTLNVEGRRMWPADDKFSSSAKEHQMGFRLNTDNEEKRKEISDFISYIKTKIS